MSLIDIIFDAKANHIIAYGTLLGSNIFQSFLAGPVAWKALPRAQFSTLQTAITPPYFALQTVLPVVLAFTWPGEKVVAAGETSLRQFTGASGLMQERFLWKALVPIAVMFATSALNLIVLGPATTKVMKKRKHQETRDGKKYFDPGPKTSEMQRLNKSFAYLHGAASSSNLFGTFAMIYYGYTLAAMI